MHFARVVRGVVKRGVSLPGLLHLVPAGPERKDELLRLFASAYGREDVAIVSGLAKHASDRTLATEVPRANEEAWEAAGYEFLFRFIKIQVTGSRAKDFIRPAFKVWYSYGSPVCTFCSDIEALWLNSAKFSNFSWFWGSPCFR